MTEETNNLPQQSRATGADSVRVQRMGSRLAVLERRMTEAKSRAENAYWMNRSWTRVEELLEEYADAKHEYKAAQESATVRLTDDDEQAAPSTRT
jgi:hypothetical protein